MPIIMQRGPKVGSASDAYAALLDVQNEPERKKFVASADIVISLLPPSLHYLIALDCLESGKNLLTASYIEPRIRELEARHHKKGSAVLM